MLIKMKSLCVILLLLMGMTYASEVARVIDASAPVSILRNFEQTFISKGSRVMRRDLLRVEEGTLKISSGKSEVLAEGPASFQLQRKNHFLEVTLHQGRLLLDCRKGEGWELKVGEFNIRGDGGLFHLELVDESLEVAVLEGESVEYFLNGNRGGYLKEADAGKLNPSSSKLQFERKMSSFEIQVYRDSLIGSVVQVGEMMLDLEGKPYVPFEEMKLQERKRRKSLLEKMGRRENKAGLRVESLGRLDREFKKNLEEAVDANSGFTFPAPLSPIPSP